MPDGQQLGMNSQTIWCERCAGFSEAERLTRTPRQLLRQQEYLEGHERQLRTGNFIAPMKPEDARKFMPPLLRKWIAQAKAYDLLCQQWEQIRTAPSRCLRCGNLDIFMPDEDAMPLPHTPCKGSLRWTINLGGAPISCTWTPHLYTPDGELISLGRQSSEPDAAQLPLWYIVPPWLATETVEPHTPS